MRAAPPPSSRSAGHPPAIVVGGDANALSVARALAARGVAVHALNVPGSPVLRSRHCTPWPRPAPEWREALLESETSARLAGAVLLTCSDEAIELVIENRAALAGHFTVELGAPSQRRRLLDKLATYRAARAAGVPAPRFAPLRHAGELDRLADDLQFPVIVKPTFGPPFQRAYGRKYLLATDRAELRRMADDVLERRFDAVLMEFIPGPDDQLCSYYTYVDESGDALVHFTKRVGRRYPTNMGGATYHVTDHIPEARQLGLRLFRYVGLRGLGNVEFKRDERDGRLKLIECNARFTAANELVERSGIPLAYFVYRQLVGDPIAAPPAFAAGLRMVYPVRDLLAFRQLRRAHGAPLREWLRDLAQARVLPYWRASDPLPGLAYHRQLLAELLARR